MSRLAIALTAFAVFALTVLGGAALGVEHTARIAAAQVVTAPTSPAVLTVEPAAQVVTASDAEPADLTREPVAVVTPTSTPEPVAPVVTVNVDVDTAPEPSADPIAAAPEDSAPAILLMPCEHDSADAGDAPCYWDARAFGNGFGTSFVFIDGVYFYPEG